MCGRHSPRAAEKRGRGMPHTPFRQVVNTLLYLLITGCRWCDVPRGPQWASKSATHRWLQRWQADGTLAAMQARMLGLAEESGMIRWEYGAVDGAFSPWEGWGRGRRPRGKGKGILIHSLTEGDGMPLANRTTPANGDERAQVVPLLDAVQGAHRLNEAVPGNVSRSSRRIKAMMRKRCASSYGSGVSGRRSRSASGRPRKTVADRSKKRCRGSKPSGPLPGSRRSIVAWWSAGSALPHALRHFWPSPRSISGSLD